LAQGKKSMSPQWTSTQFALSKIFHTGIEQIETETRKYQHMLRELMLESVGRPWVKRNSLAWFQTVLFSIPWIQRTSHLKDSRLRTMHSTMTQNLSPEDASYSWQNFKPSIPYPLLAIQHVWCSSSASLKSREPSWHAFQHSFSMDSLSLSWTQNAWQKVLTLYKRDSTKSPSFATQWYWDPEGNTTRIPNRDKSQKEP
jgi:hypothetical protein